MSRHPVVEELLAGRLVLLDGATGTELSREGHAVPELATLQAPEAVRALAARSAQAGSRIVCANTFQAHRLRHGELAARLVRDAVRLAREGAGPDVAVFGSVGPVRAPGTVRAEAEAALRACLDSHFAAGVDGVVVETMLDLDEAACAVAHAHAAGVPVVATFSFDGARCRTRDGLAPRDVVQRLRPLGVDVVGANCGVGLDGMACAVQLFREVWPGPLWIKPSAGLPRREGERAVYDLTPAQFADGIAELVAAGATAVGGCCGTRPEFIAALRARLET